jgi:hypothetical protein
MTYINPVDPGIFVLNIPYVTYLNIQSSDELKKELDGTASPSSSNTNNTNPPNTEMEVMQFMLGAQSKAIQNLQNQIAILKTEHAKAQTPQDKSRIEDNMFRLNQTYQNKELQYTGMQSAISEMSATQNASGQNNQNTTEGI